MTNAIPPKTRLSIKPTKASTSVPPSTTSRISTPILPNVTFVRNLTPGGILAGLLALGGGFHIVHNIRKQIEEGIFSFFNMNNVFLTIAYTVGSFFTYNHTKAPTNLFETNLMNSAIKDFVKNAQSTIKENQSFKKIFNNKFISNINNLMNEIIKEASSLLGNELERRGYDNYPDSSYDPDQNIHPLTQLYKKIYKSGEPKEAAERLKAYIKAYGGASLLQSFGNFHKDIESNIMQALIGSGNKDGTAKAHIDLIESEINQILIPNGVALLPMKHNPKNCTIDLYFVFTKNGYPKGDTSSDPKLHTAGISISLTPAYFLHFIEKLTMYINAIKEDDIVSQISSKNIPIVSGEELGNLNKVILSNIGLFIADDLYKHMKGTRVVYDPSKGESGGFTPTQLLGPIEDILNRASLAEIEAASKTIGLGAGITLLPGVGVGGLTKNQRGEENEERDQLVHVNKEGTYDTLGGVVYDELNEGNSLGEPNKPREETLRKRRETDHRNELLNSVLNSNKGLGIVLREGENSRLTELKLSLIALQLKFLNDRSILGEKRKILRINAFYEKHKDVERNKIIEEIGKRKDEVTNSEEIDHEINIRLEEYKKALFEGKVEAEHKVEEIKINLSDIDSIVLSKEKKNTFEEEYSNMANSLSGAISELLPENKYLGEGQQLKLKEAGTLASKYNVRDFLLLALDGSLTAKDNTEAVIKVNGDKLSINFTDKDGNVEERILKDEKDLFYELARSTPGKTTTQAMNCLEKLLRVLDKDQATVLREKISKIKDEVLRLSNEAKEQKIGGNGVSENTLVDNLSPVNKS